ncbi:MAG: Crp/Fnr family transcriptional regulator [Gammaproteobacteria bacterium]
MARLHNLAKPSRPWASLRCFPVNRGASILRPESGGQAVYVVKSGSAMSYLATAEGLDHVLGFALPGDTLRLVDTDSHDTACDVQALETSEICSVKLQELAALASVGEGGLDMLFSAINQFVTLQYLPHVWNCKTDVEQRIEKFLLDYSDRLARGGFRSDEFTLKMTRYNIARYLGTAPETVSRKLSLLQKQGVVSVHGKTVRINDRAKLAGRAATAA